MSHLGGERVVPAVAWQALREAHEKLQVELSTAKNELSAARQRVRALEAESRRTSEIWQARLAKALEEKPPMELLAEHMDEGKSGVAKRVPTPREVFLCDWLNQGLKGHESMDILHALCWAIRRLVKPGFGEALIYKALAATKPERRRRGKQETTDE